MPPEDREPEQLENLLEMTSSHKRHFLRFSVDVLTRVSWVLPSLFVSLAMCFSLSTERGLFFYTISGQLKMKFLMRVITLPYRPSLKSAWGPAYIGGERGSLYHFALSLSPT